MKSGIHLGLEIIGFVIVAILTVAILWALGSRYAQHQDSIVTTSSYARFPGDFMWMQDCYGEVRVLAVRSDETGEEAARVICEFPPTPAP